MQSSEVKTSRTEMRAIVSPTPRKLTFDGMRGIGFNDMRRVLLFVLRCLHWGLFFLSLLILHRRESYEECLDGHYCVMYCASVQSGADLPVRIGRRGRRL